MDRKIVCHDIGIPNDKWTEHKFELKSEVDEVAKQNLIIQSQNVIDCLRFFIGYTGFLRKPDISTILYI